MDPPPNPLPSIKALTFDVFGTVVDWRTSITEALTRSLTSKLPPSDQTLTNLPPLLAQQWRSSYSHFTRTFDPSHDPWTTIDEHHLTSLTSLLTSHSLLPLFTPSELAALAHEWHTLAPWPDSSPGIARLNTSFITSTLSNGNLSLLADLNGSGGLGFQKLISAEDFKAYKPNEKVYKGACEMLGLKPGQVAMVAAHLGDLEAAGRIGMRTVYVEREGEEEWDEERRREARGWVDVWVGVGEGGLEEVARRLGV